MHPFQSNLSLKNPNVDPKEHYLSDYKDNYIKRDLEEKGKPRSELADRGTAIVFGSDFDP